MPPIRCSASLVGGSSSSQARSIGAAARPDVVRRDAAVEHPRARLLVRERLGEQLVQLEHLDVALAHLQDEVVVILLRLLHPQHVVEQQLRRDCPASSRWCARPGRQTSTTRSVPTSL